jgi:outer membrane protein
MLRVMVKNKITKNKGHAPMRRDAPAIKEKKMKKTQLIVNIVLIAGLLGLGGYQLIKKDKTVYVDVGMLMQEYKGMKAAQAAFQEKSAQWQANADTLIAQFQQELKNYEKERPRMTKREKELKEELLRNKQIQINQYQEAMQMKARDEEQALTQNVINTVNDYIREYGKQKGYTFIMGATGQGNIVYAQDGVNITDEIIEGLNKEWDLDHPAN